jgi:hypothetical protein
MKQVCLDRREERIRRVEALLAEETCRLAKLLNTGFNPRGAGIATRPSRRRELLLQIRPEGIALPLERDAPGPARRRCWIGDEQQGVQGSASEQ